MGVAMDTRDAYAARLDGCTAGTLRRYMRESNRQRGIVVRLGGPDVMTKDQLVAELADRLVGDDPRAGTAAGRGA